MMAMRLGFTGFRICLFAAAALGGLLACDALAAGRERGRPIGFSEPKSYEVATNLLQLTSKKDGLKQLEEDLYKPLQTLTPKSSLQGVVAPPLRPRAAPVIQSKRVKELLDRRKNWLFMSPEDLFSEPTVDEILKEPEFRLDGEGKKELPALERYYQRLFSKRPAKNNPSQLKGEDLFSPLRDPNSPREPAALEDPDVPNPIEESARELRKLFDTGAVNDPLSRGATVGTLSDTFGLSRNALSKEQMLEHKKHMDEYRALLDPSWQPPALGGQANPLAGFAETATPVANPGADRVGSSSPAPLRGLEAQAEILNPQLGPSRPPDVNAQALGPLSPAPVSPKVEPVKIVTPTFTAPKRSF